MNETMMTTVEPATNESNREVEQKKSLEDIRAELESILRECSQAYALSRM